MNVPIWKTALIGFGKIGAGYADDPLMARYYPYATHAQVLQDCPNFDWTAVVDPSPSQRELARQRWQIEGVFPSIEELIQRDRPEVAIIATPPDARGEIIEKLPDLLGIVVEKPLGLTLEAGEKFLEQCRERNILVQVNLWRRGDKTFYQLAEGKLSELMGRLQGGFGVYGNGFYNNGTHVIDFIRMLFGEIARVRANGNWKPDRRLPIAGDANVPFTIWLNDGVSLDFCPLDFQHYREIGFDFWGDRGRLSILNEGLNLFFYPLSGNRAIRNAGEIAHDRPRKIESTVGQALYRMYENLAAALSERVPLYSSGESALQTAKVVEAVVRSAKTNGSVVEMSSF
ncbi:MULTISPECIES: Gfo/Idh/MocA family oxidoreductase [Spirulina sp. CCY15215]|uniref:Gfo/Idh/MocA family protein n=1 Tax=Spirulina sp. CCY15215 TaxID=2767591 RepID=UPI00194F8E03